MGDIICSCKDKEGRQTKQEDEKLHCGILRGQRSRRDFLIPCPLILCTVSMQHLSSQLDSLC